MVAEVRTEYRYELKTSIIQEFFRYPPSPLQHPERHHLHLTADTPTRKQAKSRRCLLTVVHHHRYSTLKGITWTLPPTHLHENRQNHVGVSWPFPKLQWNLPRMATIHSRCSVVCKFTSTAIYLVKHSRLTLNPSRVACKSQFYVLYCESVRSTGLHQTTENLHEPRKSDKRVQVSLPSRTLL